MVITLLDIFEIGAAYFYEPGYTALFKITNKNKKF